MSFVIVETLATSPLTPEKPTETDLRVLACLTERNATWQYSLLSSDRLRMLCIFEAPDAESVRESYRRGGGIFQQIWAGDLIQPESQLVQRNVEMLKVAEGIYPHVEPQEGHEVSVRALYGYAAQRIEWVQSYLSCDRTRLICELNTPDAESVQEVRKQSGSPCDRVWSAMVIQP